MGLAADVVVDWQTLMDAVSYKPHLYQKKVHASSARNRVVSAGRRFGKSRLGGFELFPEFVLTTQMLPELQQSINRREFWIVGPEYSDSEKEFRVIWDILKRQEVVLDKPGSYNNPVGGDMHISALGGKFQVHAKSAKYPETLVGEGLSGVIMAEAAKLKETVWTRYIRPTLSDFNGWALFTSTPEGKNWFYEYWKRGIDPAYSEWSSWRMPGWLNPYVYPKYTNEKHIARAFEAKSKGGVSLHDLMDRLQVDPEILALVFDLTQEAFNQEVAADFTEFVGRVFKEFDEEVHVGDFSYDPGWQTFAAVDYGFTNPFVWLLVQVGPWGEIRVLDEIYERGLTIPEAVQRIKSKNLAPDGLLAFYPDPASPGDTRQLSDLLRVKSRGSTGGTVQSRVKMIRDALIPRPAHLPAGHPGKKPKLMIDRKCVETIREFNEYRYPKSAEEAAKGNLPENPMKKDDHTPEALGRFFAGHFRGGAESQSTRIRQSSIG